MYGYSTVVPAMTPYAAAAAVPYYSGWNRFRYGWGPNYGVGMGYGYMPYGASMMGYTGWY